MLPMERRNFYHGSTAAITAEGRPAGTPAHARCTSADACVHGSRLKHYQAVQSSRNTFAHHHHKKCTTALSPRSDSLFEPNITARDLGPSAAPIGMQQWTTRQDSTFT